MKRHHRAKVDSETVEKIRVLHEQGYSPVKLAKMFKVSINTLNDWIYYRTRGTDFK